jgi:hypothetical protein
MATAKTRPWLDNGDRSLHRGYFGMVMFTFPLAPMTTVTSKSGGAHSFGGRKDGSMPNETELLSLTVVPLARTRPVDKITVAYPSAARQPAFSCTVVDPFHLLSANV